jgi:hypothetical protein
MWTSGSPWEEVYNFRPEFIFPFLRDALMRFPSRLPLEVGPDR